MSHGRIHEGSSWCTTSPRGCLGLVMSSALKNCSCTAEDIHIYDFYASFGRRRYRKPIKRMIVTSVSDSDGMCEGIGGLQGAAKKFRGPDGPERPEPKKASNGASWRSGPKSSLKLLNLDAPCISSRIKCCNLQLANYDFSTCSP